MCLRRAGTPQCVCAKQIPLCGLSSVSFSRLAGSGVPSADSDHRAVSHVGMRAESLGAMELWGHGSQRTGDAKECHGPRVTFRTALCVERRGEAFSTCTTRLSARAHGQRPEAQPRASITPCSPAMRSGVVQCFARNELDRSGASTPLRPALPLAPSAALVGPTALSSSRAHERSPGPRMDPGHSKHRERRASAAPYAFESAQSAE